MRAVWVAAKDCSLYFLLLKDRHTRYVWVSLVAKKRDVLREFEKWLVVVERQTKKTVFMLCSDRGGEFLEREFTDFVNSKGIVHDLTAVLDPQAAAWWQAGAEGLHGNSPGGVAGRQKDWEVLELNDNKIITTVEATFYEMLLLEVWKAKCGPASGRTQANPLTSTSNATFQLLAKVGGPVDKDVEDVQPPPHPLVLAAPPLVADRSTPTRSSATGDEGSREASPVVLATIIAGG
ncbi:unnamed protein product [Closterium sp. NIES-53]